MPPAHATAACARSWEGQPGLTHPVVEAVRNVVGVGLEGEKCEQHADGRVQAHRNQDAVHQPAGVGGGGIGSAFACCAACQGEVKAQDWGAAPRGLQVAQLSKSQGAERPYIWPFLLSSDPFRVCTMPMAASRPPSVGLQGGICQFGRVSCRPQSPRTLVEAGWLVLVKRSAARGLGPDSRPRRRRGLGFVGGSQAQLLAPHVE